MVNAKESPKLRIWSFMFTLTTKLSAVNIIHHGYSSSISEARQQQNPSVSRSGIRGREGFGDR